MQGTFHYLQPADLKLLQTVGEKSDFLPQEVILKQDETPHAIFFIQKGFVEAQQNDITLARLGPDEIFGEMSLLEQIPASASVIAVTHTTLLSISTIKLDTLFTQHPEMASRFYKMLAIRLSNRLRVTSKLLVALRMGRGEASGSGKLMRVNLLSKTQIPIALIDALSEIKSQFVQIENSLKFNKMDDNTAYAHVEKILNTALQLLEKYISEKTVFETQYSDLLSFRSEKTIKSGMGAIIFRELFPILMLSSTIAQLYARPRGVLEDFESKKFIQNNHPSGDGFLGKFVDQWFLTRPICQGRRAETWFAKQFLSEQLNISSKIAFCDLTAGATLFADQLRNNPHCLFTCIDSDIYALENILTEAKEYALSNQVKTFSADIRELWSDISPLNIDKQDVFFALALFEYLTDQEIVSLFNWIDHFLSENGAFLLTTILPSHPDLALMSYLLEWPVKPRDSETIHSLFEQSTLGKRTTLTVSTTDDHMLYGVIKKSFASASIS